MIRACDYPYSMKNKEQWLREKERHWMIKDYLKGLIGIPMIFEGNSLCPECLHHAMDIYGGTWYCKVCDSRFPATVVVDKWGTRWLRLNDVKG